MNKKGFSGFIVPALLLLFFILSISFAAEQNGTAHEEFFRTNIAFDSAHFIKDAKVIKETGLFSAPEKLGKPPIYPILIAVFGDHGYGIPIFQAVLATISLGLLYWVTLSSFGRAEAVTALLIGTMYAPFTFYTIKYIRTSVVVFELMATFSLVMAGKNRPWVTGCAGLMTGVMSMTRPYYKIYFPLILLLLLYELWNKRDKTRALNILFFTAAFALSTLALPSPQKPGAVTGKYPVSGTLEHFVSGNILDSAFGYLWQETPMKNKIMAESHGSITTAITLIADEVSSRPAEYSYFYFKKLRMLLGSYEFPSNYNIELYRDELSTVINLQFMQFGWIVPFALFGIALALREARKNIFLLSWLAITFFPLLLTIHNSRYRLPAAPFFIIFAGAGAVWFFKKIKQRDYPKLIPASIVLVLALIFCRYDYSPLKAPITSEDYYNLALAHKEAGEMEKADFYLIKANKLR